MPIVQAPFRPRSWKRAAFHGRPPDIDSSHRPDLVALDCMSYTPATKDAMKADLKVPVLLAITATGRVLREMLD